MLIFAIAARRILLILSLIILMSGKIVSNTNLSPGDFVKRYGERVFSRLRSMTVFWNMTGKDKRSYAKVNAEGVFVRDEIQKTKAVNYAKEVMADYKICDFALSDGGVMWYNM